MLTSSSCWSVPTKLLVFSQSRSRGPERSCQGRCRICPQFREPFFNEFDSISFSSDSSQLLRVLGGSQLTREGLPSKSVGPVDGDRSVQSLHEEGSSEASAFLPEAGVDHIIWARGSNRQQSGFADLDGPDFHP